MPTSRRRATLLLALSAFSATAHADEIHVMISGAFSATYKAVLPAYEKQTGDKVETSYGPSLGETPQAIPNRLLRGEPADVLIMARIALDALVKQGRVAGGSEVDLVRSRIGMAVKAGARKPDISSVEALKRTLRNARSIAYSDSASGVYLSTELFQRLGVEAEVAPKSRMIQATPVGMIVARGEAEIGFQQISELIPIAGIVVVGPLPEGAQKITLFSAGVTTSAKSPVAAKRLIAYLASRKTWPAIRRSGLQPASDTKSLPASGGR